jgi:hypothetical protein
MVALSLCSMAVLATRPVTAMPEAPVCPPLPEPAASDGKSSPQLVGPAFGMARDEPEPMASPPQGLLMSAPGEPDRVPPGPSSRLPRPMFGGAVVEEVDDDLLADQRGGFSINGLDVSLGAQIETFIDGQLSLVTTVNWTEAGASTTRTVSGLLTPASGAELQAGLLDTGHLSMNVGNASVFLANGGRTAVIQNTDSGIQNVLINTANNTNIQTQVTATIDLGGYAAFRNGLQLGTLGASLGQAISAATTNSLLN